MSPAAYPSAGGMPRVWRSRVPASALTACHGPSQSLSKQTNKSLRRGYRRGCAVWVILHRQVASGEENQDSGDERPSFKSIGLGFLHPLRSIAHLFLR